LIPDICFLSSARAGENPLANLDSVEVPARSKHVVLDAAFLSPDGHLVLQANGLDNGLRANFYDAQAGAWLLPSPLTSNEDIAAEQTKLTQGGYVKLEHMPMIALGNGATVINFIDVKRLCFHPYANFLEILRPDGSKAESAVFLKAPSPRTIYFSNDPTHATQPLIASHECISANGGDPALTAHYEQQSAFFFPDKAGGFFMLMSRYAIHFDKSGNSAFFKGQDNPVYLAPDDAKTLRSALSGADKSGNPQDAIDQADALIDRVAKAQGEAQQ
jgi:hypothetical protein